MRGHISRIKCHLSILLKRIRSLESLKQSWSNPRSFNKTTFWLLILALFFYNFKPFSRTWKTSGGSSCGNRIEDRTLEFVRSLPRVTSLNVLHSEIPCRFVKNRKPNGLESRRFKHIAFCHIWIRTRCQAFFSRLIKNKL